MSSWQPNVENLGKQALGAFSGFKEFILRGNVVDLAVGIMIGAAFNNVVNALVNDIITPLIPATGKSLAGLSQKVPFTGGTLQIGAFINTVISFLILALVIYFFVVRPVNALMAVHHKGVPQTTNTRDCPFCLSSVPLQASRCAYCTSQLPPPEQPAVHNSQNPQSPQNQQRA